MPKLPQERQSWDRVAYEKVVLRCGIYPREIDHRKLKRKSYRSV
jgi:hypothetical protein